MIARALTLTALTALAAAALTGCVRVGPMETETWEFSNLGEVTQVVLDTAGDLVIVEGDPGLTIHAPEGVLPRLTSAIHDGVLELGQRGGPFFFGGDIRYELSLPSLDGIEVNGSGDVEATASGGAVRISINGSGDIEVTGSADSLDVEIDGSGEVDADDLAVGIAVVRISGSGDVRVYATGTLDVEISGSGTVTHRGGATVTSDISGSGSVDADD
jgi:hypothetical protein